MIVDKMEMITKKIVRIFEMNTRKKHLVLKALNFLSLIDIAELTNLYIDR